MAASEASGRARAASKWRIIRSWVFSTDPVRVGVLWIAATLLFFFIGGFAAMMIRAELTFPGRTFLDPAEYNAWFTLHGTMMAFFFAVPVFFGIGSLLVPRMIGTSNLAFPRLNAFDFWLILLGGLILEVGFLLGERPMAGWTSYTPLSLAEHSPGRGQDWWAWGILIETLGGTLAGANFLVTILRDRRPGLKLRQAPIMVWAILFTSVLTLFAGPVLIAALAMMILDRNAGTLFFDPAVAAATLLWQDLFWFYSHPATYVMLIPAIGIVSMIIPRFAGRSVFSYGAIVVATAAVTALGFLVWWHHMLVTGMHLGARLFGAIMSWAIAVPSGVLVFTWLLSLRSGRLRFTTPMLFAIGWILMFTIGGVNGLYMAYVPFDHYVHETYWLVAHFHYIIFSGTVLGIFAAIYYWFPSALGVQLNESLGKLHFWGTLIGMNVTFFPMHFLGLMAMPRRVVDYSPEFVGLNFLQTAGMFLVAAAMAVFLANVLLTLVNRRRVDTDVWGVVPGARATATDASATDADTGTRAVHLTAPQPHQPDAVSAWPFVAGIAVVLMAVGLMLSHVVTLAGLALAVVAVVAATREVAREHARGEEKFLVGRDLPGTLWGQREKQWWLAVGFIVASAMLLAAIARALAAHGLYHPDPWPLEVRNPATALTHGMTLLLAASGVTAAWAARAARNGREGTGVLALTLTAGLGFTFLAARFLEWSELATLGFLPGGSVAGSGFYAVTGYHSLLVFGGAVALLAQAWGLAGNRFRSHSVPAASGALLYWGFVIAAWLFIYLVLYLRLVVWEGRYLI